MNLLDVVVLFIVAARTWFGYRRGFILQAFELAGLITGLAFALSYYYLLQVSLSRYLNLPAPILAVIAFLIILLGVLLVARLLGQMCTNIAKIPGLGIINALSGALAGGLVALLVIAFFLSILRLFPLPPVEAALSSSLIVPYLEQCMPPLLEWVEGYLPGEDALGLPLPREPVPIEGREL